MRWFRGSGVGQPLTARTISSVTVSGSSSGSMWPRSLRVTRRAPGMVATIWSAFFGTVRVSRVPTITVVGRSIVRDALEGGPFARGRSRSRRAPCRRSWQRCPGSGPCGSAPAARRTLLARGDGRSSTGGPSDERRRDRARRRAGLARLPRAHGRRTGRDEHGRLRPLLEHLGSVGRQSHDRHAAHGVPGKHDVTNVDRLEHRLEIDGQSVDRQGCGSSRADTVSALVVEDDPVALVAQAAGHRIQISWLQPQQWGSTTTGASGLSPGRSHTASCAPSGVRTIWWSGRATSAPHPRACRSSSASGCSSAAGPLETPTGDAGRGADRQQAADQEDTPPAGAARARGGRSVEGEGRLHDCRA